MGQGIIDPKFLGARIQHRHFFFSGAVVATALVTAAGTGISIAPLYFRWNGSVSASILLTAGSSGASIFRSRFVISNAEMQTPWWDNVIAANTGIFIEIPTDPGVGEFDIWFIFVRTGAGAGGTVQ